MIGGNLTISGRGWFPVALVSRARTCRARRRLPDRVTMCDVLTELEAEVRADPESLGLILHGSRALGTERPDSDYDLIRVVTDSAYSLRKEQDQLIQKRDVVGRGKADVLYQSPERLRWLADNAGWWTATYVEARVLVDGTGEVSLRVEQLVAQAGELAWARVPEEYDGYLNSFVRSLKAWRRGDELGGRLHAAESALFLIRTLFGLEHLWPPYHDMLGERLTQLEEAQEWSDRFLRKAVLRLLSAGDPTFQQELELMVEALMSSRGVQHDWGDELEPLKRLRYEAEAGSSGSLA